MTRIPIAEFPLGNRRDATRAVQRARLLGSFAGLSTAKRTRMGRAINEIAAQLFAWQGWGRIEFAVVQDHDAQSIEAVIRADTTAGDVELEPIQMLVDRVEVESDTDGHFRARIVQHTPAEQAWVTVETAGRWSEALKKRTTRDALVESQEQIRQLADSLSGVQQRGVDLERELEQVRGLNETLELLALVASKTDNAVVIMDADGQVEWVNEGFSQITGYEPAEVRGKPFRDQLHGADTDAQAVRELGQAFDAGRADSQELLHYRKDGRTYWASLSLTPVLDDQGRRTRWIGMASDISKRRQVQEALQKAREAAEAANQIKSKFLANISHEIRTPMNAILGMTELVLDTDLSGEQREYLDTIQHAAETLLDLLNDLLDLSKIEAGKLEIDCISFRPRELLDETLKVLDVRARQKSLSLTWTIEPDVPQQLLGDPLRLRQVLINLVGNALKFTDQGKVEVEVEPQWSTGDDMSLQFTVKDTGIGIPADKLGRVFEAFTQADGSTSRLYGGTGLGLAISSQLVDLMGGRIWVHSEVGVGSTFRFCVRCGIPGAAAQESLVQPDVETAPDGVAGPKPLSLLVADDHPANRMLATRILQKRGHRVTQAASGNEALLALAQAKFDAVVMDVQMPDVDGFEATAILRGNEAKTGEHVPVIAMTAYAMSGDRERCLAAGMDAYIAKPIRAGQLIDLVERLVGGRGSLSAEASPVVTTASLDFGPALARVEGDVNILKEQLHYFLTDAPRLLEEIGEAITNRDARALTLASHRLKGLASNFDGSPVADVAWKLEQCGQEADFRDAQSQKESLATGLGDLQRAVREYLDPKK